MAVLSLHSQVVRGHVGNSAAQFAMQRLGHGVWNMPTVLFSNHPGHGGHKGRATPVGELLDLLDGIEERGWLPKVQAVLTGYIGDDDQIDALVEAVDRVKSANPDAIYVCDPVIGDKSGPYADGNIIEGIMDDLVPRADYVTPNRFELALMLDHDEAPATIADGVEAARLLPNNPITIVTSMEDTARFAGQIQTLLVKPNDAFVISTQKIGAGSDQGGDFKGAGDLLTALLISGLLKRRPLEQALAHANGALYDILSATDRASADELLLIANQERLVSPLTTVAIGKA